MTMQGDELKAIRTALGLTQGEMANRLGLTPTFIGMMERGDKPIEVRTAYAARYLVEHPEQAAIEVEASDAPTGSFVQRLLETLRSEPKGYGVGDLETFSIDMSSASRLTTITVKCRRT